MFWTNIVFQALKPTKNMNSIIVVEGIISIHPELVGDVSCIGG